jgi:hypothetical protein
VIGDWSPSLRLPSRPAGLLRAAAQRRRRRASTWPPARPPGCRSPTAPAPTRPASPSGACRPRSPCCAGPSRATPPYDGASGRRPRSAVASSPAAGSGVVGMGPIGRQTATLFARSAARCRTGRGAATTTRPRRTPSSTTCSPPATSSSRSSRWGEADNRGLLDGPTGWTRLKPGALLVNGGLAARGRRTRRPWSAARRERSGRRGGAGRVLHRAPAREARPAARPATWAAQPARTWRLHRPGRDADRSGSRPPPAPGLGREPVATWSSGIEPRVVRARDCTARCRSSPTRRLER